MDAGRGLVESRQTRKGAPSQLPPACLSGSWMTWTPLPTKGAGIAPKQSQRLSGDYWGQRNDVKRREGESNPIRECARSPTIAYKTTAPPRRGPLSLWMDADNPASTTLREWQLCQKNSRREHKNDKSPSLQSGSRYLRHSYRKCASSLLFAGSSRHFLSREIASAAFSTHRRAFCSRPSRGLFRR